MTPYERLMAEAIPTGRFGDSDRQTRRTPAPPPSPEQQAVRRAAMVEAQSGWRLPGEASLRKRARSALKSAERAAARARIREESRPRHLHIVPDPNDTQAA
ncbi:hypothetical protein ACFU96_21425 [Streptomyces sp. NPDC057620]|uniref:hypothetical protein n=1 Tax=Streptomyces sp. NPDC057620 TaxID=3346185 RepID=UPI0036A9E150